MRQQHGLQRSIFWTAAALAALVLLWVALLWVAQPAAVAMAEPEQTYDIRSAADFEAYSRAYAAGNRNPKDVLNISINSGDVVTTDGFVSLGTASRPFAGTLLVPTAGIDTFHLFNCPLFDYVSTDLVIGGAGTVKIVREAASDTPAVGTLTQGALFANHVVQGTNSANWRVTLSPYTGDGDAASSFACVLGDVADGCHISLTFTNTTDLAVQAAGDAGLLCGTLGEGATLVGAVAGSGGNIAVQSTSGNAGGLVGTMQTGSTLQCASANLSRVNAVTASAGYAGGLVGSLTQADITFAAGVSSYDVGTCTISGATGAGGLFGLYEKDAESFVMTRYGVNGATVTGTGHSGGIFGYLHNTGGDFDFDGCASASKSISVVVAGGNFRGGIAGTYEAAALADSLCLHNIDITMRASTATISDVSGGLLGNVAQRAAYVGIYGNTVSLLASPDAGLVGSVGETGSFVDVWGTNTVSGTAHAGVLGRIYQGVLRLAGTTDLKGYVQVNNASGLIARERGRALVYARGDATGTNGNWTLLRNLANAIDDVASWGEVVRTDGTILAENDLFQVDMTAHTVTLRAAVTTMSTVTQFALTALNIQLNSTAAVGALQYTVGGAQSATLLAGTLTLGADITLAGTGLTGLTRDDGANAAFSGTLDGGGHTLTLATGERYGLNGSGAALAADSKQGNIYRHKYNGLLAKSSGATIQDLGVAGSMIIYQSNDEMYAGGVVAEASGSLVLDTVATTFSLVFKTADDHTFRFGGAIGTATGNGLAITATDCIFTPTVTDITASGVGRGKSTWIGGFAGTVTVGNTNAPTQSITVEDSALGLTYTKSINSTRESCFGGIIASVGNAQYTKDSRTITLNNNTLAVTATGTAASNRFGGFVGTQWLAADVSIDGLTVTATVVATGGTTAFGGLVQVATGHWDIVDISLTTAQYTLPNNGSSFGFVAAKAYTEAQVRTDGTATVYDKNALYVDVTDAGYDIGALSFVGGPTFAYYDEIVASSLTTGNDITQNGEAIVSITTSGNVIDTTGSAYNTYLDRTAYGRTASGRINTHTRYYYDLAYARANAATAKYGFLLWSVKQYAHTSLAAWFAVGNTFTGNLDMTGLSYYPVDLTSGSLTLRNATVKLDNILMEAAVHYAYRYNDGGLQTSDARTTRGTSQHYLMHTALLRNMTGSVTLDSVTLQGNVPRLSDAYCGFVVAGTVGNSDTARAKCALGSITLDGVYISTGDSHITTNTYAPLCLNKVGKNSTLDWNGATQSNYGSYGANGYYAGSSPVGDVGSATARAIYLTFGGMALDARASATSIDNMDTTYGTTKALFSRASLLNSLLYFAESAGSYTFELDEDRPDSSTAIHAVTYGKEITSSLENADKQKRYYGSEYYVDPTTYQAASGYDFSTGWLPYVYVAYNLSECKHELSVNVTFISVIEGCGKYGDPYIIDDNEKLPIVAKIIAGQDVGSAVQIYLPDELTSCDYTSTAYTKYLYNFGASNFVSSNGGSNQTNANVRRYLAGAYIVIAREITLPADYVSLGASDAAQYAYRGVLLGLGNPTVTNLSRQPLIHTSTGCVVQGLTIDVDVQVDSSNIIPLAAPTGSDTYQYSGGIQAYGAVIGQIVGGDTFIDAVQVTFSSVQFSFNEATANNIQRLTPLGGYVGALVNGGLVFRNMSAANVGLTAAVCNKVTDAGYLYVNPIIGRVIAGYAFYEGATYHPTEDTCTLKNGLKNYTIADLSPAEGKLGVTYKSSTYAITVPNGQALFVLAAVVNSGAASAAYSASAINGYQGLDAFWSAYRAHTMARAGATYAAVGTANFASNADYTDYATKDSYTADGAKIPYIVRAYTALSGTVYLARCVATVDNAQITVSGNCDVAAGFRGIGSIYYESDYVRLRIAKMTGRIGSTQNAYCITLHMRYLEYNHTRVSQYIALGPNNSVNSTAGFGLFNVLKMKSPGTNNCIQYLQLAGSIFYDVYATATGAQAQYAFANYSTGSKHDRPELGSIQGTDNEDITQRRTILSVGGVAGITRSAFYIKNVTFADLSVEGAKSAGGMVGFAYHGGASAISYIVYDSASVQNTGYINVVGGLQAGGLVGRIYRAAVQITGATGGTDIVIKNIESKAADPNETGMVYYANLTIGVGGLVGTCWAADGDSNEVPTLEPASTFKVRRLFISNINVTKGTNAANVRVRNDSGTKNNYAGGFVGSAHNVWLQLTDCNLQGVNITANIAGGFVGKMSQKYYLYLQRCNANGSNKAASITGTRYAGGAVGWTIGRDTIYFQLLDYSIRYYVVQSTITTANQAGAGGAVGYTQGDTVAVGSTPNYVCEFNNLTVLGCDIKTNYTYDATVKYKCGTGGVIGVIDTDNNGLGTRNTSNKYKFSGYNILVKDCTFTHKDGGTTDKSTAATNRLIGDIVGNNGVSSPLKLVGVSVQNDVYCGKHVGYCDSDNDNYGTSPANVYGDGYLVLANYHGVTDCTQFANIDTTGYTNVDVASPYVTANPARTLPSALVLADGVTTGMILTGDGIADSVANLPIQSIRADGTTGRYGYAAKAYYNGSSGDNNLTVFNSFGNKFVQFSAEVADYLDINFPVLLVDDTNRANTHRLINSYLRLLTNTTHDFGTDQAGVYSVAIYNVVYTAGAFGLSETRASLRRADGQFYMANNAFDSGKAQFSLIDVRFYDPAPLNNTSVAYHLYVPVFVKKVLNYTFDIAVQSGTNYLTDLYEDEYGQALIENVGTPVTLYFQYTYNRTTAEWTDAINAGENVWRNYAKSLLFYKANTNDILQSFPAGTVLVLVDPNRGGKPYYATIGSALTGTNLNLSAFYSQYSIVDGVFTPSGEVFAPRTLSDMLSLSVSQVGGGADKLVACPTNEATVVVGGQGYRAADEDELADGTIDKYTVSVGAASLVESYYLSIFTQSNALNDLLFHYYLITAPTSFAETEYPSKIADTGAHTMVHLVMGKIFYHDALTVGSASKLGPEIMSADNNELTITLTGDLGLSADLDEDIKANVSSLIRASSVYHSFVVYLNRNDGTGLTKAIIGDPTGTGTYLLDGVDGATTTAYTVANIHITQNYAEFVTADLSAAFAAGTNFQIQAQVTLSYASAALLSQFPGRGPTTPDNGVTVSASSNLAFSPTATAYSKNSLSQDESPAVSYYSEAEPEVATLDLNPIGDKLGDFTPLGINANNNDNAVTATFDLLAVLDISSITEVVSDYTHVGVAIKLAAKTDAGLYADVADIDDYLVLSIDDVAPAGVISTGARAQAVLPKTHAQLVDNGAEITLPQLHITVYTGDSLEAADLPYTNYRITVEVWLQDSEGVAYGVSRADNYVIYTNARILPDYIG